MHIRVYIYIHTYMHIRVYIYTYMYTCACIFTFTNKHVFTSVSVCLFMSVQKICIPINLEINAWLPCLFTYLSIYICAQISVYQRMWRSVCQGMSKSRYLYANTWHMCRNVVASRSIPMTASRLFMYGCIQGSIYHTYNLYVHTRITIHTYLHLHLCQYSFPDLHLQCKSVYTCIRTAIHTYVRTYLHTAAQVIYTYIYIYIQIHIYIYIYSRYTAFLEQIECDSRMNRNILNT